LVSIGHSDREISDILSLKGGTVRNYISEVMKKTGTKNRTQLVHYALSAGIVSINNTP
jgi:DNA-binding CsgD family transcriptional regulator